jgi:ubiquinone/menaquinone biosynthesis C-methylase UbiE
VEEERLRALNALIARNYDEIVYDPDPHPLLTLGRVCGQAALFGEVRRPDDVLDIGCGTGAQLLQVAPIARGRLVGVDLSNEACNRARTKLEAFGKRVTIECADLLELSAERLGSFDMVSNIGVIFVVPEPVRSSILELIGRCLRPGGVALISYYAGTVPALRANVHRTLRAACAGMPAPDAVASARQYLEWLAGQVADAPGADHMRAAIAQSQQLSDVMLFHEALNNESEAMQTAWIERQLAAHDLAFASYLPSAGLEAHATSQGRGLLADALDFAQGSYRYAVFIKDGNGASPNFRTPQVVWETSVARNEPRGLSGEQTFSHTGTTVQVTVRNPASAAMLDILAEAPCSWPLLVEQASNRAASAGHAVGEAEIAAMEADLRLIWKHGLVLPNLEMAD